MHDGHHHHGHSNGDGAIGWAVVISLGLTSAQIAGRLVAYPPRQLPMEFTF